MEKFGPWLILAAWLGLTPIWIQGESLWIDEAGSAVKALADSPGEVWKELWQERNSNLHLPAYHYYLWGAAHLWGHGECALRFANVPWLLLGFVLLLVSAASPRQEGLQLSWLALFLTTSPFLMYYANEVRPYAMQFGLACMSFAGMWGILQNPQRPAWGWVMVVGTIGLAWTTVYGLAWWLINLWLWVRSSRRGLAGTRTTAKSFLLVTGGLAAWAYHGWVVSLGASASQLSPTSWGSLGYGVCEWAGAAGFLPGRSSLRAGATPTLAEYGLAFLTVGLALALLGTGVNTFRKKTGTWAFPVLWALPSLGILASGILRGFRLLGRHFFPVAPAFFMFLSAGFGPRSTSLWIRLSGFALVALWLAGSFRLAKDPSHRRDDYRGAAGFISQQAKATDVVWWAADGAAARYYGLRGVFVVMSPDSGGLAALPPPDWVVLSKPDIFDGKDTIRTFLRDRIWVPTARFQSFEIYRRDLESLR